MSNKLPSYDKIAQLVDFAISGQNPELLDQFKQFLAVATLSIGDDAVLDNGEFVSLIRSIASLQEENEDLRDELNRQDKRFRSDRNWVDDIY